MFDEAFALDAQLILGSLVTPATAARPPAQRLAGPAVPIQEVSWLCLYLYFTSDEPMMWYPAPLQCCACLCGMRP